MGLYKVTFCTRIFRMHQSDIQIMYQLSKYLKMLLLSIIFYCLTICTKYTEVSKCSFSLASVKIPCSFKRRKHKMGIKLVYNQQTDYLQWQHCNKVVGKMCYYCKFIYLFYFLLK